MSVGPTLPPQTAADEPFLSATTGFYRGATMGLGATVVIHGGLLLATWMQVSPFPVRPPMTIFVGLFVLGSLAALLAGVSGLVLLFKHSSRGFGIGAVVGALLFLSPLYFVLNTATDIRTTAFRRMAERSVSLVEAITGFYRHEGLPPKTLGDLVPIYMPQIPNTGIAAYPNFEYHTGERAAREGGNPWVLMVSTPTGFLNFDQFKYYPNQNYPQRDEFGWYELIGDWAYLHE